MKYCDEYGFKQYVALQKEYFVDLVRNKYTNCPNCAAPITNLKCNCGTKFNINVSDLRNITISYSK